MKTYQIYYCLIPIILGGVFLPVTNSEDDLTDFEFNEPAETEWNYGTAQIKNHLNAPAEGVSQQQFATFDEFEEDNQVRPFDWREKLLRSALSKALTNASLRQKFVEIMPILRVLSSQQRLALSALISAQINDKTDQGLKLEQVRRMFGDDKKLLLPIVYDIANLVRNSARKYLDNNLNIHSTAPKSNKQQSIIDRRLDILSSDEQYEDDNDRNIGNFSTSVGQGGNDLSLEDFFSESAEEMLDPKIINEKLQEGIIKNVDPIPNTVLNTSRIESDLNAIQGSKKRGKRDVTPTEFVHKLIRSVPFSIDEDENHNKDTQNMLKLNTSGFLSPKDLDIDSIDKNVNTTVRHLSSTEFKSTTEQQIKSTQSYQEIEDAAFASFNETDVKLQDFNESLKGVNASSEPLPKPEELKTGPRYRLNTNKIYTNRPNLSATKRKRIQMPRIRSKESTKGTGGSSGNGVSPPKKCERFTSSMCIRTDDYPLDQIMGSIRRHKNAMVALWADYHDKSYQLDTAADFDGYSNRRREDDATGGGMCQSIVRYARPQKARSASGEWKYIVNTAKHSQTLRLEKCTTPQESCSYLAHNYRSHCAQIYNYHRLLSWDKTRGLHVDIFKVPTCCSCQVDGFRQQFPPVSNGKVKEYTPAYSSDIYSTINDELDYNDEQDEDDLSYQINNGFKGKHKKHDIGYDNNDLLFGSQSTQVKLRSPNPTLGSYLRPPGSDEEYETFDNKQQQYKRNHISKSSVIPSTSSGRTIIDSSRRRPYKSLGTAANVYNGARVDLDFSPSELHLEKEVNFSGGSLAIPNKRVEQKWQSIHSVPHTANPSTSSNVPQRESPTVPTITDNFPMASGFETTATLAGQSGFNGNRNGAATNAHQAPASDFFNTITQKQTNLSNSLNNAYRNKQFFGSSGKKPKPIFRSAAATPMETFITTTVTRPTPSQTKPTEQWSIFQPQQPTPPKSPHITTFHINSIHNPEYNKSANNEIDNINTVVKNSEESVRTSHGPGAKRINYSYHPIIDFFETQKYLSSDATSRTTGVQKRPSRVEKYFPPRITKPESSTQPKINGMQQSHERRIGIGISNSVISGNNFQPDDNAWHPVIIEKK